MSHPDQIWFVKLNGNHFFSNSVSPKFLKQVREPNLTLKMLKFNFSVVESFYYRV